MPFSLTRVGLHSRWGFHPEDPWGLMIENVFPSVEDGVQLTATVSDNLAIDDPIALSFAKVLSDNFQIDDVRVLYSEKVLDDTLGITDPTPFWGQYFYVTWEDNVNINDAINRWGWQFSDNLSLDESGMGDLIHESGQWIGHRDFNLLQPHPRWGDTVEVSVGWGDTTRTSGDWDTIEREAGSWTTTLSSDLTTTESWVKKEIP